jgi:hypothetical protein
MRDWIPWIIYWGGYLSVWRTVAWKVTMWSKSSYSAKPEAFDIGSGIAGASVISLAWPPILAGAMISRVYTRKGLDPITFLAPRHVRREIKVKEQAKRIEELEYELGIGGQRRGYYD